MIIQPFLDCLEHCQFYVVEFLYFLLSNQPLDDVDCSPLQSRKLLLQAEMLLNERKQVDDWVDQYDVFPPITATYQDLESLSSITPVKNLSDRPPRNAKCFDKVPLSEYLDKSINEQPASITEKIGLNPIRNV